MLLAAPRSRSRVRAGEGNLDDRRRGAGLAQLAIAETGPQAGQVRIAVLTPGSWRRRGRSGSGDTVRYFVAGQLRGPPESGADRAR
jgi:hypothetical protein